MATTIKSTDLDFNEIKNSLKVHLQNSAEFSDYNFEASALSSLLDVLAYNTHQNSLVANYALNESFLSTAQLRSSLVGLASSLGYTVNSRTASYAVVNLFTTINVNPPSSVTLPAGSTFSSTVDNKTYTFQTRNTLIARNNGSDQYFFAIDGNQNVPIYEGVVKTKSFIAGQGSDLDSYVIPVTNLDLDTVKVTVFDSPSAINGKTFININGATSINEKTRLFVCKETPNGFYELSFGNGVRLGSQAPVAGNKILVEYTAVSGAEANGARTFSPDAQIAGGYDITVTTIAQSGGGNAKESIESIRKNAPYIYASQNRMVTAEDYAALTLRSYANVIKDIKAWGGEDNFPATYGSVFLSIEFSTTDATVIANTKEQITNLAKDLSVASFDIKFSDPVDTFLEVKTFFQFNPNLTSSSRSQVESNVASVMETHFKNNLGAFDKSFRRSNMLSAIDAVDGSVLSSRAEISMQSRFDPKLGAIDYIINYPTSISLPDDTLYVISSGNFFINGKICFLRNVLDSNVIQAISVATGIAEVDDIGSYDAGAGTVTLNSFGGTLINGEYVKINATPANQSVINPFRNNILKFDATASTALAVLTDTV